MSEESISRFYSSGKLLLTGEYLVLHGALALAVPASAGQYLYVHSGQEDSLLHWKTTVLSSPWFECSIDPENFEVLQASNDKIADGLTGLLKAAGKLKGDSGWLKGVSVAAEIGFDVEWGLGSSSSLISNIAWWAGVDPFQLFRSVSPGSGYDIACARARRPVLYRVEGVVHEIEEVDFHPPFSDRLAFVYLARKQDSAASVEKFLSHALVRKEEIVRVSEISRQVVTTDSLDRFETLLEEHEQILSGLLDRSPVKEVLFRDYPGLVKSLGAWGGDFVLVSLGDDPGKAGEYFASKGFDVLVPYNKMVIQKPEP